MERTYKERIKGYFRRTWKNKVVATGLIFLGFLSALISSDATAFVWLLLISSPLLFAKENFIG